jgi:hypothetical protein
MFGCLSLKDNDRVDFNPGRAEGLWAAVLRDIYSLKLSTDNSL